MSKRKSLYEILSPSLPDNVLPIVSECLREVSALPGIGDWLPTRRSYLDTIQIVRWGFPLSRTNLVESLRPLRQRLGEAILRQGEPNLSDLAEINGAALCAAAGAVSIELVPVGSEKTPDFKIRWPNDTHVDAEITAALEKPAHRERMRIAHTLSEQIHDKGRPHDVILHCVEPPSVDEWATIAEAARTIEPGTSIDVYGRWQMRAELATRDPYTFMTGGQLDVPPDWWPSDVVRICSIYGFVAGPDAKEPPPQTRSIFGVPLHAYINPVQSKAERPQGVGDKPFLICTGRLRGKNKDM